jgi:L-alanine-DL-glutamate epimerase-like enolase superfamily enzyme
MKITWEPLTLHLKTPFRIAHGISDQRSNVLVKMDYDGVIGIGEAAAVPYYQETQAGIFAYLQKFVETHTEQLADADPCFLDDLLDLMPAGSLAARTAIDIALHDLFGKIIGHPLYRILGLNPTQIPETSYTIAIDTPQAMAEIARQTAWPVYKVKLGSPDDEEALKAIRQASPARLRVDANAGWDRFQAARLIPRLAESDLELVEQPLPADDIEGLRWLHSLELGVPIFADESVRTSQDVARLSGVVDGVVIKLMKSSGIREALRAIHTARALGLKVMLSCMVESSIGVTAAAHLAPLCDYVDLDGPMLIHDDPFQGVIYQEALLALPDLPGLGLTPREVN